MWTMHRNRQIARKEIGLLKGSSLSWLLLEERLRSGIAFGLPLYGATLPGHIDESEEAVQILQRQTWVQEKSLRCCKHTADVTTSQASISVDGVDRQFKVPAFSRLQGASESCTNLLSSTASPKTMNRLQVPD